MNDIIDVCLAGNPAVNGVCGDVECVCAPHDRDIRWAVKLDEIIERRFRQLFKPRHFRPNRRALARHRRLWDLVYSLRQRHGVLAPIVDMTNDC